ncbi:MAG: PAS domain-containing protein [Arcobacteraceae bacterium]
MKNLLHNETINLYLLKPIASIFVVFFIIISLVTFYLDKHLYIFAVIGLLFVIVFLMLRYYIYHFRDKVLTKYTQNFEKIEASEKYLKEVEDASSNLIIAAVDDKIEKVNKAFCDFTGYANLEEFHLEHKCIGELFVNKKGYLQKSYSTENWSDYVTDSPYLIHKAILLKENVEHIFMIDCKELHIDDKKRTLYTFVDITEFENLQTRYQLAINGTQDGLWDWNLINNTLYFSPQWKKQLGYEEHEIESTLDTWESRVHPADLEKAMFDIQQNVEGKTIQYENKHRLKHKDGSWVWILDRGQTIFDESGVAVRMVGFHTDITKMVLIEEELHQKDEMMIAQSQNAAMGEMISMIAHQWRQPLSVISMGANNIMADIQLNMINEKNLENIASEIILQTSELSKTIDDFREFFKPKRNKENVYIKDVFADALNIIGKSLENNDIIVTKSFESKKNIKTHSRELMQVILNILKNSKEILVENNIKNKEIHLITKDDQDSVIIEITDNAGGIPKWVLPKIFDPYFSTKDDKTGTGLGLYMCKTIVEKHLQGQIIASNTDLGASFKLILHNESTNE